MTEALTRPYNAVALAISVLLIHLQHAPPVGIPGYSPISVSGAVAYMKANGIQGRVFHDYVWGGYLIWHTPELKVFIDGRWDPYAPTGVFKNYCSAASNENPQAVLDKYRVEYVLMPPDSPLSKFLKSSPAWAALYSDQASVLFHRSQVPQGR